MEKWPKTETVKFSFLNFIFLKNFLPHCLSVATYSDYWIKVKLGMTKWVKQGKSNERVLKN